MAENLEGGHLGLVFDTFLAAFGYIGYFENGCGLIHFISGWVPGAQSVARWQPRGSGTFICDFRSKLFA